MISNFASVPRLLLHTTPVGIAVTLLLLFVAAPIAKAQCTVPQEFANPGVVGVPQIYSCTTTPQTIPVTSSGPVPVIVTFSGGFLTCCEGYVSIFEGGCPQNFPTEVDIQFSAPVSNVSFGLNNRGGTPITVTDNLGETVVPIINPDFPVGVSLPGPGGITKIYITTQVSPGQGWFFGVSDAGISFFPFNPNPGPTAGTLIANPPSGTPGTEVTVTGTGWVNQSCCSYYNLFLDVGTPNALSIAYQLGLACDTQPNMTFTIPCETAPGSHTITNQLINSITGQVILSSPQPITFTVVRPAIASKAATNCALPQVVSVKFETLDGQPLEVNPMLGNELPGYGGGVRFFPDASSSGGQPNREVVVKVQITPAEAGVDVFVRSFDVDDSSGLFALGGGSGNDNQGPMVRNDGIPQQGAFDGFPGVQTVNLQTDDTGLACVNFIVTMQPGDNFKVVASVNQDLINRLFISGQQIKDIADPAGNPLPEEVVANGADAVVTKLLTVWRQLHVEVDSMPDPPDKNDNNSNTDAQRNFIRGNITAMDGTSKLYVDPQGIPIITLDDGSPNLTSKGLAGAPRFKGNGRFENGMITVGINNLNAEVKGNGVDKVGNQYIEFVQLKNSISIPFVLTSKDGSSDSGSITNIMSNGFDIDHNVKDGHSFANGTLVVAGVQFAVVKAAGHHIDVQENAVLPFLLVDDDKAISPFLESPDANTNFDASAFAFMQPSDDPSKNLYATGYIKPIYDIDGGLHQPKFIRNLDGAPGSQDVMDIIQSQDVPSTDNYWVVYLQGAFQGATEGVNHAIINTVDNDPDTTFTMQSEQATLGITDAIGNEQPLSNIGASAIFRETIRDFEVQVGAPENKCLKLTSVHETGHQFSLGDNTGGIMSPLNKNCDPLIGQVVQPIKFLDSHLIIIRRRLHPQDRVPR